MLRGPAALAECAVRMPENQPPGGVACCLQRGTPPGKWQHSTTTIDIILTLYCRLSTNKVHFLPPKRAKRVDFVHSTETVQKLLSDF